MACLPSEHALQTSSHHFWSLGLLLSQAKYFDVMEFDNVDIFRISYEFLDIFFHELYRFFAALLPPQL
jgi:hypothetical protein